MQPTGAPFHQPTAAQRLIAARDSRERTDYVFDFWTAFGWTVLSCGMFGFFIWYKLCERMREHNRRRLWFLEAANELAWERAGEQGRQDELRPRFQRVGADLQVLRGMTTDFREPAVWLVIIVIGSTIATMVLHYLLDQDLMKHRTAEADAERELNEILLLLALDDGYLPHPAGPKSPHNYAARVVATIASCGVYFYWWLADIMREGNDHFRRDWAWEDAIIPALVDR